MVLSPEVLWHEFETAAKFIAVILCTLFAIYFWKRRQTAEMKETRRILLGQGLFVFSFGLTRLGFLIADLFSPDVWKESPDLVLWVDLDLYFLLWKISTIIGLLAIIFLLLVVESYLVKISRYIFSIVASICLIIVIFSPTYEFGRPVTYIAIPIAMAGVIALYAYLFFKSSGELRKKVSLSLDGFIIFGVGVMLETRAGQDLIASWVGFFPAFISIAIMVVGLAIYTYYNVKD